MTQKKRSKNVNAQGRRVYNDSQFMQLPYSMTKSLQFRSLAGVDVKIFIEICGRHNGSNNGRIGVGYQDLADTLMLGKSTIQRSLKRLQEAGFIKLVKKGKFAGRIASEWQITLFPCEGHPPTNEWGRSKPVKYRRKPKMKPLEEELNEEI